MVFREEIPGGGRAAARMWGEQEAGMNRKEIDLRRMVQQRLIQDPLDDPKELVA